MANYTALSSIQVYFNSSPFSSATSPKGTEVTVWIEEATALINGALHGIYTVPITHVEDLKILRSIADQFVVEKVEFVLGANNYNVVNQKNKKPRAFDFGSFMTALKALKTGKIVLINSAASSAFPRYKSFNQINQIVPKAAKEANQW